MYTRGPSHDDQLPSDAVDMRTTHVGREFPQRQGKNTVWTMQALYAADQLRQRAAWAYAQIFVVSDKAGKWKEVEAWQSFYDIFVRHAFGNFRDMMREVSFSPMMANYLTMLDNAGHAYSQSYPDENYAYPTPRLTHSYPLPLPPPLPLVYSSCCPPAGRREIMQLFTIGLVLRNDDFTPILDDDGLEIPTCAAPYPESPPAQLAPNPLSVPPRSAATITRT